jgi:hypothetical protein
LHIAHAELWLLGHNNVVKQSHSSGEAAHATAPDPDDSDDPDGNQLRLLHWLSPHLLPVA